MTGDDVEWELTFLREGTLVIKLSFKCLTMKNIFYSALRSEQKRIGARLTRYNESQDKLHYWSS